MHLLNFIVLLRDICGDPESLRERRRPDYEALA